VKRLAVIVEGYGDQAAVPNLISRMGELVGQQLIAPNPIRAGEWKKIRRAGELENFLELAYRRSYEKILVFLDLDDGCAAAEAREAAKRVQLWRNGRSIDVGVVFAVKEYESMFLSCLDSIVDLSQIHAALMENAENQRDAKGALKEATGKRYKETQDQLIYTRMIDLRSLIARSRSFRKLCKEVTGLSYQDLTIACSL
jgi:hypothetical protein